MRETTVRMDGMMSIVGDAGFDSVNMRPIEEVP